MFMEGAALLEQHGYLHYEISNFARMGFQCRHNLGYWEGADYLGMGPSATSTIQNRRWTNPAGQNAWNTRVRQGSLDAEAEILSPQTRVLELLMLRLRPRPAACAPRTTATSRPRFHPRPPETCPGPARKRPHPPARRLPAPDPQGHGRFQRHPHQPLCPHQRSAQCPLPQGSPSAATPAPARPPLPSRNRTSAPCAGPAPRAFTS